MTYDDEVVQIIKECIQNLYKKAKYEADNQLLSNI